MNNLKRIITLIGIPMLLLAFVACSNDGTSSSTGDDNTELTVWLWGDTGLEEQFRQYDEEHDDVTLNLQLSSIEDHHTNLTTSLGAGSGAPDIAVVEGKELTKYFENPENFYNLFELGAEDIEDEYLDWKFQQGIALDGESLIALPLDIAPITMAYNIEIFEEAGLPTDREEVATLIKTWDDYLEIGKQIKKETGKNLVDSTEGLYYILESQLEDKYYDEQGELIIDQNSTLKNAYDYVVNLSKEDLSSELEQFTTEWGTATTKGDFATISLPSWARGILESEAPESAGKWDMTSLPEGSGNHGGSYITIPKQSDNSKEAFELIKWITSSEQQLVTFKQTGQFPSTPSVYNDDEILSFTSDYFNDAPIGKLYVEASKKIQPVIEGASSYQIERELGKAVLRVEDKGVDPDKSWEQSLEEIKRQINR